MNIKFSVFSFQFSVNDQFSNFQLENLSIRNPLEIRNWKLEFLNSGGIQP